MVRYPENIWRAFKEELHKGNKNSKPKAYGILKRYRDSLETQDSIKGVGVGVTIRVLKRKVREGNVKGKMYHAYNSIK